MLTGDFKDQNIPSDVANSQPFSQAFRSLSATRYIQIFFTFHFSVVHTEVTKNPKSAFPHSPNQPLGNAPSGAHCFIGLHTSNRGFGGNFSVLQSNLTASGRAGLCGEQTSNSCWLPVCFLHVSGCYFLAVEYREVNVTSLGYSISLVPKEVTCINN